MAKTAAQVTDQELAVYRATARQQKEQERQQQAHRIKRAQALAQQAAVLLKEQFGAQRIRLEIDELAQTVSVVARHWAHIKISPEDQDAFLNSVALNLHSFYNGLIELLTFAGFLEQLENPE